MGALEFAPAKGPPLGRSAQVQLDELVELASQVLTHRATLQVSFAPGRRPDGLREILRVGTSAGGARAKAIVAWNRDTNEVRSGQVKAPAGFDYWLLKFDGVSANQDKSSRTPRGIRSSSMPMRSWPPMPISRCPSAACWKRTADAIS